MPTETIDDILAELDSTWTAQEERISELRREILNGAERIQHLASQAQAEMLRIQKAADALEAVDPSLDEIEIGRRLATRLKSDLSEGILSVQS